jgi:hypothetical protein
LKINLKTNIGFFLVLFCVIILAFIEGIALSKVFVKETVIQGSKIQLISFILITIFIIVISTLKPNKLILASYSSMTLGLIVIITSLFDPTNNTILKIKIIEIISGLVLIISGFIMSKGLRITNEEQRLIKEGIKNYKKL